MDKLDLDGLKVESIEVVSLEGLESGHGMTEIDASCGAFCICATISCQAPVAE
ncbi:GE37468 family thiazolyl peptide [Actinomadura mexicana]|uniref:Uncharacterized protein n=1 Tax=Actinomadura mexicana TaxID=134959 RepID=A0A239HR39_9ACTN|nr:GE37468 family thiazolyl peptide [Actinomadura mexicana]SNS83817.1 hypothetical protein SAMN06265355_1347 [Actinomadura mexicana]